MELLKKISFIKLSRGNKKLLQMLTHYNTVLTIVFLLPLSLTAQSGGDSTDSYYYITQIQEAYYDSLMQIRSADSMKGTGFKSYIRWKAFMERRVDQDGLLDGYIETVNNYLDQSNANSTTHWNYYAPVGEPDTTRGGFGKGWVNQVVMMDNVSHILAGTHNNGIWETKNNGSDWYCITKENPKINGIASMTKNSNNEIFAFTYTNISVYSNGLYKGTYNSSTDKWEWQEVDIKFNDGSSVYPHSAKKRVPRKVLVHPLTNDLFAVTKAYIFKSSDGGTTWNTVCDKSDFFNFNSGDEGFEDLIVDTQNSNIMYVAGTIIIKSIDSGNTWDSVITQNITGHENVITCKMDARTFNGQCKIWFLYNYEKITAVDTVTNICIKKLSNGVTDSIYGAETVESFSIRSGKINIAVHPEDEDRLYVGGVQLYSIDTNNFKKLFRIASIVSYNDPSYLHDDIRDMFFYQTSSNTWQLCIGCDGGVSRGEYQNNNVYSEVWHFNDISIKGINRETDLNISEVYSISTKGNNGAVGFNCQDIGGYFYNGEILDHIWGGDGAAFLIDNVLSNYYYYNDIQFGFLIGDFNNKHTNIGLQGMPSNRDSYFFPPVVKNPSNPQEIYFGVRGLFKYNDIYNVILNNNEEAAVEIFISDTTSFYDPTDIAISRNNPNIMYVSTKKRFWNDNINGALWVSYDKGSTWTDLSQDTVINIWEGCITDIELDPFSDEQLWLTYSYSNTSYPNVKRYYYNDEIDEWTIEGFSNGLPSRLPVYTMKIDPISGDKYIATDVGVFKYDTVVNEWDNISGDMQRVVTDIEINNYNRRLYVSTFGAGIWYTELDDCPGFNDNEYIIDGTTEVWVTPKIMNRNVVVKNGGQLTIKDIVYFHNEAKLIVERGETTSDPGGKVILDGGKLTNGCDADFWQGVEVYGYPGEIQNSLVNGWLVITNKGSIENAKVAVLAGFDSKSEIADANCGGVIRVNNGVFINNKISIEFKNLYKESLSDIYNSTFIINNDYQYPGSPEAFIKLTNYSDYGQPEIFGCSFLNTKRINNLYYQEMDGIVSYNSSFSIDEKCLKWEYPPYVYDPPICVSSKRCRFENLEIAISASGGSSASLPVSISNTDFINNKKGIYLSAVNDAEVLSNYFSLRFSTDAYGLYLDQCTGYHVEDNTFTSEGYLSVDRFGIIVNYSGQNVDEIYRNNFNHINTGINIQDENRNSKGEGLHIRCNQFTDTYYDIKVLPAEKDGTYIGIAQEQGAATTEPTDMVGNNFYYNYSTNDDDLDNELLCLDFNYYYPSWADKDCLEPIDYTSSVYVTMKQFYDRWFFEEGCYSKLESSGGGIQTEELEAAEQSIDSLESILVSLIDEGDTESLVDEVETSTSSQTMDIYNQLLNASPYLSDTVVSTTIENEELLPNAMVRDIMVANTHTSKSEKLMAKLDERNVPMPGYMKAEILQGKDSLSTKEDIEAALSSHRLKKHTIYNSIQRQYLFDTINPLSSSDSLVNLYINDDILLSKYKLAFTRLKRKEYTEGSNVLSNIPYNFDLDDNEFNEYQSLVEYYDILLQADTGNINSDSALSNEFWDIYNSGYGIAKAYARNYLIHHDSIIYNEPIAHSNPTKSTDAGEIANQQLANDKPQFIKIMPNPANDYIIIEYQQEMKVDAIINIIDLNGNLKKEVHINSLMGQEIIKTDKWVPGVYIASIIVNNKKLQSLKFSIVN